MLTIPQCDERRPTCLKCEKARRKCSGYRDQVDLIFRDENRNAARHASRKTLTVPNPPSPTLPLVIDPESLALVFFFTNFDRQPDGADGVLTVLPRIYSTVRPDSALFAATSAIALATFTPPGQTDRPYMAKACQEYGKAIAKLRSDCQDPAVSTEDETLLAALLMGLLEVSPLALSRF